MAVTSGLELLFYTVGGLGTRFTGQHVGVSCAGFGAWG